MLYAQQLFLLFKLAFSPVIVYYINDTEKRVKNMKLTFAGDSLVRKLMGTQKVSPEKKYRWSDFAFPFNHEGKNYIFNNLNKRCYEIEENGITVDRDARFSCDEIAADKNLTVLLADAFLVPESKLEWKDYETLLRIMRITKDRVQTKGYKSFIILPTTTCNARCVYCFEQGTKYITMTEDIVDQTIRFILNNAAPNEKIKLTWFGGEPLIGEKTIDKITDAVRAAGIDFSSVIVTNGSLVTSEIADKMVNRWNVDHLQITLDGVEEEYNRRKNYYFNYESAYWHVLGRIKLINDKGIFLCIRVNIDEKNADGVKEMIDDIRPFISQPDRIVFDLVPLFDVQNREEGVVVWEKLFDLLYYIDTTEFSGAPHGNTRSLKLRHCMAEAPHKAVTIAPDGKLYNCENVDSFESIGTVFEGVTNAAAVKSFSNIEKTAEKCKGCLSLPVCTTFTQCKNPSLHCKFTKERYLEYALKKRLDNDDAPDMDEYSDDDE